MIGRGVRYSRTIPVWYSLLLAVRTPAAPFPCVDRELVCYTELPAAEFSCVGERIRLLHGIADAL